MHCYWHSVVTFVISKILTVTDDNCFQAEGKAVPVQVKTESVDDNDTNERAAAWSILRDDFMIGAKMKDWDKQMTDSVDDNMQLDRDSDDDDDDDSNGDDDDDYS